MIFLDASLRANCTWLERLSHLPALRSNNGLLCHISVVFVRATSPLREQGQYIILRTKVFTFVMVHGREWYISLYSV